MTITILTIGKSHDPALKAAIEDFSARLQRQAPLRWRFIPYSGLSDAAQARKTESVALMATIKPEDTVILLDERGQQWDSPTFARHIERWTVQTRGDIVFVIGGAYGVDQTVHQRALAVWSLSPLVFPHAIARLIVVEQLYRAYTILNNMPYHHA